jgi:hypothetical protein
MFFSNQGRLSGVVLLQGAPNKIVARDGMNMALFWHAGCEWETTPSEATHFAVPAV